MSDLGSKLAAWLSAQDGKAVEVRGLAQASAGARRLNALFEAVSGDEVRRLALTMIPYAAIQILDVTGEAAVRTLAEQAGVPTPHIHYVCPDDSVLGGPFFISTTIDGETVPRRLLRLVQQTGVGPKVAAQLGTAMAHLHAIDPAKAPMLPRPVGAGPIATALLGVDEALKRLLQPSPTFAYGVRWLERHAPAEPTEVKVIHTDVRTGNIIVGEDGLRAILDWEGARIGDPMEDTAWPAQRMWRFREDDKVIGGLAGADVLRDAYIAAGGEWDQDRYDWWRVLGTVRWGLSLAGQAIAHLDGSYPSIVMAASGRRVAELEYDALLLLRPGGPKT